MEDENKEIIWDELRLSLKWLLKTKIMATKINALGNPLSLSTELKWSIEIQCASFNHYESV